MKHAYLIIAHNDFSILEKQLLLLDDPRNDFYVHIDKKVKDFPFDHFKQLLRYSNIHFVRRLDVRWGDDSQIECELLVLSDAIKGNYRYYHLLSGVDMPLKTNDEIHCFFEDHDGLEFIHFCSEEQTEKCRNRIDYYHSMRFLERRSRIEIPFLKTGISRLLKLQHKVGFRRRCNKGLRLGYGANWFSITHELAEYVLSKKRWIRKHFRFSCCGDELFLQTIVINSDFYDKLYRKERDDNYLSCMRYIDWTRGNPYAFREDDFRLLIDQPYLFARKFSTKTDTQIVDLLYEYIQKKSGNSGKG